MSSFFLGKILVRQLAELVIGIPVAIIFWPLVLCLWSVVKIVRLCVEFVLNSSLLEPIEKKDGTKNESVQYRLAKGSDSIFGYKVKNNCNSVIPGYCVIEGNFDFDVIINKVNEMVQGNPRLKHRFTKKLGFYCWEMDDDKFDILNHVRIIMTPQQIADESKVIEILEKLSVVPINSQHPTWEVLLIPSFRVAGESPDAPIKHFAEILRVDHSYGDGVSFCLTSNTYLFDQPAQLPLDPRKSFPVPFWALVSQYIKVVLLGPLYFARHVFALTHDKSHFSVQNYAPTKYLGRSKSPIELSMLKEIKIKANVSVTSILMSSISSALQALHKRKFPFEEIPRVINTGNVNAMLPYPDNRIQNRFTIFPFPAPFSESDPRTLLNLTNEEGYRVTLSPDPIFCYLLMKMIGDLPCLIQNFILSISGTSIMLSNIPGIIDTVRVFGGKVIDSGAWLPLIRVTGLAVATYTYRGQVRFCGIADPMCSAFPDRSDLQQFLDDAVKEVHQLAQLYQDEEMSESERHRRNRILQRRQITPSNDASEVTRSRKA